ncbi:MAG: hypothetical protein HYR88_04000 [Verrucomicrobia bacterium]|nr:hypothetical protein [Verrucomicrobiota bacterium]MBI3869145.1 hypothetical protein [Verrucomicrobiota bacterium]
MVIPVFPAFPGSRRRGGLILELVVAIGILGAVMLPLAFGFLMETKAIRASYYDVVIMEVVDGEMEILAAGDGARFSQGEHAYEVHAAAVKNLPDGSFRLTRAAKKLRLEWIPGAGVRQRSHIREATLP